MKKLILSLFLVFATSGVVSAQDLNNRVSDLSLNEDAQYQLIDKNMIEAYVNLAVIRAWQDYIATGIMIYEMPPFMQKLDSIEFINLTECSTEIKGLFLKDLEEIKDENGYETVSNTTDGTTKIRIIARRDGDVIPQVFAFGVNNDNQAILIVRMTGKMNESDIADILKQQKKNNDLKSIYPFATP